MDQIDYEVGDKVVNKDMPHEVLGTCTGFLHNNTCIEIDDVCFGGIQFFQKAIEI